MVKKEGKNSQGSSVIDFSGLDPSPRRAPFEKEISKYSAQRCTTVPEIVSFSGLGVIVDCKDPYLQEWVLPLNNTPHTNGYTMKVEQRWPRLKPEDICALAHKDISEREALDRVNRGDKTTVTYTLALVPIKPRRMRLMRMLRRTRTQSNPLTPLPTPWVTLSPRRRKPPTRV